MKFVKNFSENQHSMKKKNFRKTEKLKKEMLSAPATPQIGGRKWK